LAIVVPAETGIWELKKKRTHPVRLDRCFLKDDNDDS
jgi:hypothetical protein